MTDGTCDIGTEDMSCLNSEDLDVVEMQATVFAEDPYMCCVEIPFILRAERPRMCCIVRTRMCSVDCEIYSKSSLV